jgi:hypothetical protein
MPYEYFPVEVLFKIMKLLSHIERYAFIQHLRDDADEILLRNPLHSSCQVWGLIFKDDSWINKVLKLSNPDHGSPIPCLIGRDLEGLYSGKPAKEAYVSLLIHDWTGESVYLKNLFFDSLNDHVYNAPLGEITLKQSGLTVHVRDAFYMNETETIYLQDISKLFRESRYGPCTSALYYNNDSLINVGPSCIGGVSKYDVRSKLYIYDFCSVRLRFRNNELVYRYFARIGSKVRAVGVEEKHEHGDRWITSWELEKTWKDD